MRCDLSQTTILTKLTLLALDVDNIAVNSYCCDRHAILRNSSCLICTDDVDVS